MSGIEMPVNDQIFWTSGLVLGHVCTMLAINPLSVQYAVPSKVSDEIFEMFLSAFTNEVIEMTKANLSTIWKASDVILSPCTD
jgi:hypothetical protein